MTSRNLFLNTAVTSDTLEAIAEINNSASNLFAIPRSKMILTTLSTVVMMACDKPLSKEYYQHTRAYLETIKNDDGTSLPNISGFLKYIDQFEVKYNIEDEMQVTRIGIPSEEMIEVVNVEKTEEMKSMDIINEEHEPALSSTRNENVEENVAPQAESSPDLQDSSKMQ
jgi:hypothetical protein